jgi:glycine betaine/proline transport system permease protein
MAFYDWFFDTFGLRDWCAGAGEGGPMTMAELLARSSGSAADSAPVPLWQTPFPSLDELNTACPAIGRTRDMTDGVENAFLAIKDPLKVVLDPITQPLSWALNGSLEMFQTIPWFVLIPLLGLLVWVASRSWRWSVSWQALFFSSRSSTTTTMQCRPYPSSSSAR